MKRLLVLSAAVTLGLSALADLCISEICPKPKGFDPNGFESGWIELYNPGDTAENLSAYKLDRTNRGKAAKAEFGALPNVSVPAKGYQVVYTSEDYPQVAVDGVNPFVTNGCVVVPFKVNPKKYPLVRLLKGSTVLDSFVVPVELDNNKSFAPAGGVFPSYTGGGATPALPQPPAAVEIAVDPSKIATDPAKGVTSVDAAASLAATNIWSLAFTFTIPDTTIPSTKTGLPLFNAPGAIYAYLDPDGQIEFQVGDQNYQVDYEGIWTDGKPHVVQLVCGPLADSRIAVAVDGTNYIDRTTGVAAPLDTTKALLFGQIADAGDVWTAFPGSISDVKLYTGSLLRIDYQGSVVSEETIATPSAVTRVILPKVTKGKANDMTGAVAYGPNAGPLYGVKHSLSDWKAFPVAQKGVAYPIEMMVNPLSSAANDEIVNVTLVYRAFAAKDMVEKKLPLYLKSTDKTAGNTYTNTVPAADLPAEGGLLQWAAIVTDAAGNSWRTPSARSEENGYKWYGTIVQPTADQVSAKLPTWHFFCDQDTLDNMDKQKDNIKSTHPYGVFCGIYDSQTGLYYDHVSIDLRGNTTAGLSKKSHSLKFLKAQPLTCTNPFDGEEIECRKTSLLAEFADPSRLRSCLSFYFRRLAGQDVPFCYPVRTQLNGKFYQLCFHTNRFKDELFEDYFDGYDPWGRAFKNCGDCDGVYCGGGVEQQLPDTDDYPTYTSEYNTFKSQFVSYVKKNHPTQSGMTAADQKAVDKVVVKTFDLPGWLNFLALSRLTQECDDGWSTLCLYYDVNRTGTWTPMAYDVHQSFGAYYKGDGYGVAGPWADQDRAKCHPYYGGMRVVSGNYSNNISRANRAYECIYQSPKFRRLMARRLRTLMDEILKEPGTAQAATPFWNDYAAKLVDAMQADDVLDRNKWGLGTGGQLYVWSGSMTFAQGVTDLWNNYIVKRRVHFFNTHSAANTSFSGAGYGAEWNAMLPAKQSPIESLTNGFLIVNVEKDGSFNDTEKAVIKNGNAEAVDMSGWKLSGALEITLPAGTVVDANDTITIVSDRKAYVAKNDAEITDQVIVGNAAVNAGVTAIQLKDANGVVVTQGMEPEPTSFTGAYTEPVTLRMSGEKELVNADFQGGLILGDGVYVLKNKGSVLNKAAFITCGGKIVFTGKGTMSLAGVGAGPLMTVGDLVVSNGTLKVEFTSTTEKSSAIQVSKDALVDDKGTLDITVGGTQGYGLALINKNMTFTLAGGKLKAAVSGTKCAAVNLKGSCDAKLKGGEVTATLAGTNAKVVNGGSQSFSGTDIDVTMPADITGMLEARPFNADKKIKISDGNIKIDIPAYGSEAFATVEAAGTIDISGGKIEIRSGDDCVSAYTDVTVSGGLFYGTSISNDVIDANGNIAISGGTVLAYTTASEDDGNGSFGLDVNEGNAISITGGSVVALGAGNAVVHGSPAGCLLVGKDSSVYSGKYVCVTGVTEKAINTLTVKLPEIATPNCTLLLYTPGVAADATPVIGDTAPAEGSLDFHDTYLKVEEIIPPEPEPGDPSKLGDFNSMVKITASGYAGTTALTNFPVLVRLAEGKPKGFKYSECEADGSDIRFGDADMNQLSHEIDTWNPNGESLIWVKVPVLTKDTELTMLYSGVPKYPVTASDVWPDYAAVWHMGEANGNAIDSTGHGLDAVPKGPTAATDSYGDASAGSPMGIARHNASNTGKRGSESCYLLAPNYDSLKLGSTFTASGWVRFSGVASSNPRIFCRKTTYSENGGWHIEMDKTTYTTVGVFGSGATTGKVTIPSLADWTYLTFVYDGTSCTVYGNGVAQGTVTVGAPTDNGKSLALGANDTGSEWSIPGWMDEFRLRDAVSSSDWIKAEYSTVKLAGFLTLGDVMPVATDKPVLAGLSADAKAETAKLSVSLVRVGDGATACDLYFACAAEDEILPELTKVATLAAGEDYSKRMTSLRPETTYVAVFKAVNNAATPKTATVTTSFTTTPKREKTPKPSFGSFANAVRYTVAGYAGADTLANYPVRVMLAKDSPKGFYYSDLASADGSDIRFADSDGNQIPYEIESWDTTGTSILWVKIPAVTAATTFMMYYGGTPDLANDPHATWSGYTGVWHMEEVAGAVADATGHGLTATPSGAGATAAGAQTAVVGVCGNGRVNAVAASGQVTYLSIPNYDSFGLGSTFTISGWVKMTGTSGYPRLLSRKKGYSDANGWEFEMSTGSYVNYSARGINNAPTYSGTLPQTLQNAWSQIVLVYNDATLSVYQNGVLVKSGAITAATDNGLPMSIGCDSDGNEGYLAGMVDEFRLADGCASADWIKADYDQIRSTGFLTASDVLEVAADEPYWSKPTVAANYTTAVVSATLAGIGTDATKAVVTVAYGTSAGALGEPTVVANDATEGYELEVTLTNLLPSTTYHYELKAVNNADPAMAGTEVGSFVTKSYGKPTLTDEFINGAEEIALKATINEVGEGSTAVDLYFAYGLDAENLPALALEKSAMVADETYTKRIAGLESGVSVVYKWMAVNDKCITNYLSGSFTPGIDFRRPDVNIAEYSRGVKMTVSGYTETETLTNFPVLVRLSEGKPTGFSYADFYSADGSDLCFIGADGKMLAHEIDTWNPQGESLVWVQVPELTKDFSFAMWYRSSKPGSVFTTDPMWSAYWGVWHLGEGGDGVQAVADSAANGLHGSTHKNSLAQPAGIIGAARRVSTKGGNSASNGQILIELNDDQKATLENMVPTFTFSAWFAFRSTGNGPDYAFLCSSKDNDKDPGWGVQFNSNSSTAPGAMRVHSTGALDSQCATYSKSVTMRKWYKMNMVWEDTTYRAYYDGVKSNSGTLYNTKPAIMGTSGRIAFGGMTGSGYGSFNGDMDEIRLKKGASSDAWIKAEYLNETTDLLTGGEVVAFAEKPKPIGSLAVTDYGAAFAQFTATLSSLGEGATTAELQAKVWAGEEPADWTTLATDLAVDVPVRAVMTGLSPETTYSYKLRVVCDAEGAQPSDLVEGTFTTVGTGASGVGGKVSFVGNDYVHVYDSHTKDLTFVPPEGVSSVQLLLVGGGGAGGHTHGGGGAGGSVTALPAVDVTAGSEYTVEIGAGGIASKAVGTASTAGTATSLKLDGTVVATANGGKAGGNNTTCNGGDNDNFKGGVKNNSSNSGGGGAGAGQVGGAASNDSPVSGGTGGNGYFSVITGAAAYYGGGGGGGTGTTGTLANPSSAGAGGLGGGGQGGGGNVAVETDAAPMAGTDGLGGGGGGGAVTIQAYLAGADGGSGFAAIRYTMAGSGEGSAVPRVSLDTATYEGDLKISIGYRVGWAGQGQDKAAVKLLWGYTPTAITREVAISDAAIGSDTFVFSAPLDQTTYYFKVMASNDAGSDESDWTLSVVVPKYSGEVPGDKQVPALEGDVKLAHVDGHNATLTGLAKSLGEGAKVASAVAYVGLTDDVLDMTNQVPVAIVAGEPFACYLTELDLDTTYYCYVEVKNDLGAAISTPVMSFTTLSGSKLSTVTVTSSQAKITLNGSLLTVGAGTTDVYVAWNNGAYEKLASFTAESASTAFSSTYDSTVWKGIPWKVMCSNECVTVVGEPTGEFWTDIRSATQNLTDTSVYTWKADDDGNWNGDWNDPAHWTSNKDVCLGYPNGQYVTATFKDCTLEHPVTVNVNGKYAMGTLTCAGTAASKIAFVGTGAAASQLTCGNLPTAMQTGSSLTFKDLTLTRSYNTATWTVSQQNRATDLRIRFVNVTSTGISDFVMGSARSRLEFVGLSNVTFGGKLSFGGEDATMVIDNATLQSVHLFMPAEAAAGNQRVIFCGAAPKYTVTGSCGSYSQSETAHFVFKLPKGGWTAAPLQMTSTDANHLFAKNYSTGASKYLVEIDPASPAVIHTDDLLTDVPLITTKKGFFTDNMGDEECEYVTLPTRKGKKVGTYAFSGEATPLSLSLKTLQGKRCGTTLVIR